MRERVPTPEDAKDLASWARSPPRTWSAPRAARQRSGDRRPGSAHSEPRGDGSTKSQSTARYLPFAPSPTPDARSRRGRAVGCDRSSSPLSSTPAIRAGSPSLHPQLAALAPLAAAEEKPPATQDARTRDFLRRGIKERLQASVREADLGAAVDVLVEGGVLAALEDGVDLGVLLDTLAPLVERATAAAGDGSPAGSRNIS